MTGNDKNIHSAHRKRVRERFLNHGLGSFEEHMVLELLLFYSIPRKDVNELAHILINTFGSLHAVFDAPVEELRKVPGVGENTVALLKLMPQVSRRYLISRQETLKNPQLTGTDDAGRYIIPHFHSERDEVVYIMCLDNSNRVLSFRPISRGNLNTASVSIRKLVEHAIRDNAAGIIMAHNHLSGSAEPSKADIDTTAEISVALKAVEIRLIDHIIVADSSYVSMLERGLI